MYIDYSKIKVKAGDGGSGCSSFRREKFVPYGGPDGGKGGKGGDIIIKANSNMTTLIDYNYKKSYKAQRGQHGKGKNKSGKKGDNIILKVPVGTVISKNGKIICDLIEDGQEFIAVYGGKGGRGNAVFATPTDQAPTRWEVGGKGEEKILELELKVLAEVGFVGFPNSGKSTLLSKISAAKPKIADYPFTTLHPILGTIEENNYKSFVAADIPGLIEGAHSGKGLGDRFLKHIERARILVFLIESISENINRDYNKLIKEIKLFNEEILHKSRIIVISKIDLVKDKEKINLDINEEIPIVKISSFTGEGLDKLVYTISDILKD